MPSFLSYLRGKNDNRDTRSQSARAATRRDGTIVRSMVGPRDDATVAATGAGPLCEGAVFAGRYVLERELGRGGMGRVYAALDRTLGERVALKLLTVPEGNASALERFRREVKLARKVTHRNAARTFDIGEHDGVHYLTMELVDGHALDRELAQRKLDASAIAHIAAQVCAGLAAAHEAGVVHRDLKPANVLIEKTGRVVITDFGIARGLADEHMTADGGLLGTLAYMAPEQIRGQPADARTDIYALGLIVFEMATGREPFPADTALASALARVDAAPPDPRQVAGVPDGLAEIVLECLAPDPDRRPADAHVLARRFEALSEGPRASTTRGSEPILGAPSPTSGAFTSGFVSARPAKRGVAVLPFKYRGPPDDAYLAESLTDELIDVLSMTRGLNVPALGATAKFKDDRDPARIGTELGVQAFVDGTVQRTGDKLRISARLVDTGTALQTWSEHYTGQLEDVFELQDRMARRIAETLRVELNTIVHRGEANADAVELYLRARQRHGGGYGGFDPETNAVLLFERCLAIAPDFAPALAGYANACIMAWFLPGYRGLRDWATVSRDAVARALEKAPDLAETHYAAARLSAQHGDYGLAARRLATSLDIAPTYPDAHEYLGTLQVESGREREGLQHIALAQQLDPTLYVGRIVVARHKALQGDMEGFERDLERLRTDEPARGVQLGILEMRAAIWAGDSERIKRVAAQFARFTGAAVGNVHLLAAMYRGELEGAALEADFAARDDENPRFMALLFQMMCEAAAHHGRHDEAIHYLARSNDNNLVDLEWLERSPTLAPLRTRQDFAALVDAVARRAQAVWVR
jgi:serine/threonine protein kinase/tetratricopeptide (TPR) repeat protein